MMNTFKAVVGIKCAITTDFSMRAGVLPGFPPLSRTLQHRYVNILLAQFNLPGVSGVTPGCQVTHVLYRA